VEINDYIKKRRIELRLTMAEVAQAVGVSEATVSRWESGQIDDIRRSRLAALANILKISPLVLIKDSHDIPYDAGGFKPEFKKRVPILGRIAAGMPIFADEYIEGYRGVEDERVDYCLIIHGESMWPTLCDGSMVYVQQNTEISNGCIVVALINGDDATVKRYYQYGGEVVLRPDNVNHVEQRYPARDVEILGRVIGRYDAFD